MLNRYEVCKRLLSVRKVKTKGRAETETCTAADDLALSTYKEYNTMPGIALPHAQNTSGEESIFDLSVLRLSLEKWF